jgi:hypothetical protein
MERFASGAARDEFAAEEAQAWAGRAGPAEDDEEELEPLVIYQRVVHSDVATLLASESISAVALSGTVIAVGMRSGLTVLLEHSGKLVRARGARLRLHAPL